MAKVALSYGHGCNTYEDKRSKFVVRDGKVWEEHTHNAAVGVRVKRILEAHGVAVLELQPPEGLDVPLQTRTDKANAWGADIYWSIHANAGGTGARGWCGFYWETSSKSKRLAELYAKHVRALELPLYSVDGIHPCHLGDWTNFHELRESHMPAIITENGFMTNADDFKLIFLNDGGHWDKLAEAHAKAILDYFGISYKGVAKVETQTGTSFFSTGGYAGDELKAIHGFLVANGFGFNVLRQDSTGNLIFDVGGFPCGSAAETKFEGFLKQNRFAYEKRVV